MAAPSTRNEFRSNFLHLIASFLEKLISACRRLLFAFTFTRPNFCLVHFPAYNYLEQGAYNIVFGIRGELFPLGSPKNEEEQEAVRIRKGTLGIPRRNIKTLIDIVIMQHLVHCEQIKVRSFLTLVRVHLRQVFPEHSRHTQPSTIWTTRKRAASDEAKS